MVKYFRSEKEVGREVDRFVKVSIEAEIWFYNVNDVGLHEESEKLIFVTHGKLMF